MNLLILLDLIYNLHKNFKFYSLQGQNVQIFFIFTYNQGKIFLILPITLGGGGGTCIPGLHWELPPRLWPMSCAGQQVIFSVGRKKPYI